MDEVHSDKVITRRLLSPRLVKASSRVNSFKRTALGTEGMEVPVAAAVDCNSLWSSRVSFRVWIEKALYDMLIYREEKGEIN